MRVFRSLPPSEITVEADSPREALDKAWQEVAKQENVKVLGGTVAKAVIQDFFVVSVEDENGKITEFDENGKLYSTCENTTQHPLDVSGGCCVFSSGKLCHTRRGPSGGKK